jgi:hypothetical protein
VRNITKLKAPCRSASILFYSILDEALSTNNYITNLHFSTKGDNMKLTPPTNLTFGLSGVLGVAGLLVGLSTGFALSTYLLLAGLALLVVGNAYEKI